MDPEARWKYRFHTARRSEEMHRAHYFRRRDSGQDGDPYRFAVGAAIRPMRLLRGS